MKRSKLFGAVLLVGILASGCASGPAEQPSGEEVTITEVALSPDGNHRVRVLHMSQAESNEYEAVVRGLKKVEDVRGDVGKVRQAISRDTGCDYRSVWLYQFTVAESGGNKICFTGTGTANLNNYCRYYDPFGGGCLGTWAGYVRSYYPGEEQGDLGSLSGEFYSPCSPSWNAWGSWTDTNSCQSAATHVRQF